LDGLDFDAGAVGMGERPLAARPFEVEGTTSKVPAAPRELEQNFPDG
jgi:hypothetical protein